MALRFALLALVLLPLTASAAQNGFGAAPVAPGAPGGQPAAPIVQPFEPWVKSAKVGDFIVVQYHAGTAYKSNNAERKTVKAIEPDCIVVEHSEAAGGKGWEERISRDEKTAKPSKEVDMAKSASGSVKLGSQSVQYEVFDGFLKGLIVTTNGQESFKALKYQKTVAQGVPLGGAIKVLWAPDDGKPIQFGKGQKTGAIKNTIDKLEPYYDVTEFGVGK